MQIFQEAVENNPKLEAIIINALKEVLYSLSALVLKSKDENDDNVSRFHEITTMVKAYIEIVNNDIEENELATNKVSSQWDLILEFIL